MTNTTLAGIRKILTEIEEMTTDSMYGDEQARAWMGARAREAIHLLDAKAEVKPKYRALEPGKDVLKNGDEYKHKGEWLKVDRYFGEPINFSGFRRPINPKP